MSDLYRRCTRYFCECSEDGIRGQRKTMNCDKCPCHMHDIYRYCHYRETLHADEPTQR